MSVETRVSTHLPYAATNCSLFAQRPQPRSLAHSSQLVECNFGKLRPTPIVRHLAIFFNPKSPKNPLSSRECSGIPRSGWTPMIERGGAKFLKELKKRIAASARRYHQSAEDRRTVEALDNLGKRIFRAMVETGLNPTEFSKLARVDEQMLLFATTGLLEPHELSAGGFLKKVRKTLSKVLDYDVELGY